MMSEQKQESCKYNNYSPSLILIQKNQEGKNYEIKGYFQIQVIKLFQQTVAQDTAGHLSVCGVCHLPV